MINQKTAIAQLKLLKKHGKSMRLAADEWENDWQILASILLSARTRDEVTIVVCEKMFKKFSTPEKFSKLKIPHIKKLIYAINFYENKSKYLYLMTKKLLEEFDGIVPHDFEKLITFPGVGNKTANVFLARHGGANIGVDTHVNYISNYLSWTKSNNPDVVQKDLEKLFPKNKWIKVNNILVTFGKTYTSKIEKNKLLDKIKNEKIN